MITPVAILWRVEFVLNNDLGFWESKWYDTQEEAQTGFECLLAAGCVAGRDDGSYGSILEPVAIEVDLTREGLLRFANNHAAGAEGVE